MESLNRKELQMATEALEKQQPEKNSLATVKQLYLDSQARAIAHLLDIVSQTYNGVELTAGLVSFWKEALKELSPQQIREGLLVYMKSERGSFKPTPADIIGNAPEATDKPRKVKNPNCPDCSGSGFRKVLVDSKIHEGQKAQRVTDCYCVAIEYAGQSFKPEQKALPAAQIDLAELLKRVAAKTGIPLAAKVFPHRQEQSDADYERRQRELAKQAESLQAKVTQ